MNSSPIPVVTILLVAAGASCRMRGKDKLLEPIDGTPLLRRQAMAASATDCPVIVTLPRQSTARLGAITNLPVAVIEVPDAHLGMAESLRLGAVAAGAPDGLMVMLADMPDIETDDLLKLLHDFEGNSYTVIRASGEDGTPGHPVIFPRECLPDFANLRGDTGARDILKRYAGRMRTVPLPGNRALTDLDTPEAWDAWRAERSAHD